MKQIILICGIKVISATISLLKQPSWHLMILFALIFSNSVNAQIAHRPRAIDNIEIQIGTGFVTLYSANVTRDIREAKVGYSAGIGLIHSFNSKFSLNTNLSYSRKGLKTTYQVSYYDRSLDINDCKCTTSVGTKESNSNLDYLILSPLIRINLKQNLPYIETGPFVSYLLKSNGYTKNLWDGTINYSNTNNIKEFDAGISLSIGYQFMIWDNFSLNAKIIDSYGLLNIVKAPSDVTNTNSIYLLLGVTLK